MKIRSKVLIATAMLCLVSMITMANEQPIFSIEIASKNTIALQLANVNEPQVQVTLKDSYGVVLHDEILTESSVNHRKYDFQNLPVGSYVLMVAYDDVIKVQSINKGYKTLEIEADNLQTIFLPAFRQHSEYVDVNMLYFADMKVSVKMRDSEGHVIYNERIESKGTFKKRFNLSQLDAGTYTFTFEIDGAVINKEFKQSINWSPALVALQE